MSWPIKLKLHIIPNHTNHDHRVERPYHHYFDVVLLYMCREKYEDYGGDDYEKVFVKEKKKEGKKQKGNSYLVKFSKLLYWNNLC